MRADLFDKKRELIALCLQTGSVGLLPPPLFKLFSLNSRRLHIFATISWVAKKISRLEETVPIHTLPFPVAVVVYSFP
jgi:hypothetical protein